MSVSILANFDSFDQIAGTDLFRKISFVQDDIGCSRFTSSQAADKMWRAVNQIFEELDQRLPSFHGHRLHLSSLGVLPLRQGVESLLVDR